MLWSNLSLMRLLRAVSTMMQRDGTKRPFMRVAFVLALVLVSSFPNKTLAQDLSSVWCFTFQGPLPRWKDGLPVGNGRIGAQSWGTGPQLFLSLDRGDVWDLRYQPNTSANFSYARLRELVRNRQAGLIENDFDKELSPDVSPTADWTPFHLPIGRLRIDLPENTTVERAELDMQRGEVRWSLRVGGNPASLRIFACATENVIIAALDGLAGWQPKVSLLTWAELRTDVVFQGKSIGIREFGYAKATHGTDGNYAWVLQPIPESGEVATVWRTETRPGAWHLMLTISSQDDKDAVATARRTLENTQRAGVAELLSQHRGWWERRWARSRVDLPDQKLERLWINGLYKLASSSRSAAPPPVQGLWFMDDAHSFSRWPYTLDMNVEAIYWPAYSSNQLDLAEPLNKWLLERAMPEAKAFTKRFFGVDGLMMGCDHDPRGRLGGGSLWLTNQYWLGAGGWMAQHLWWYYCYSMEKEFLSRAYPFMKESLIFYENILEKGDDGRLHVPLSASMEYFSNELAAWTSDPTSDLSIIRNLAQYAIAAAETLGIDATERARWKTLSADLAAYPTSKKSGLMVQPNEEFNYGHRHPMHLFPIFPGGDLTVEGSEDDRRLIDRSIQRWVYEGRGEWMGFSYPYGSLIASRVRRANHALNLLRICELAYTLPNGFHTAGSHKRWGLSKWEGYDLTELDGETAFTAAVNEMLLQSWGGKVRIFPAVPEEWKDVSFKNLRAEGATLVSAEMRHGEIISATIESEKGGEVRVVWPLGYVAPGQPFEERVFKLQPGEREELVLK